MRIAYFTDINLSIDSGVQKKTLMQAASWRKEGHTVKIFCVPAEMSETPVTSTEDIQVFDTPYAKVKPKGVSVYLRKILTVGAVTKALKTYKPDVVYAREVLWYPGLTRIIRQFPVVWEGNTLLLQEIAVNSHPLIRFVNKMFMPRLYQHLKGVVAVTEEIGELFKPYNIPVEVVANGIDFSLFPPEENSVRPNEKINIIFVGSPGMDWHGVDLFIEMAALTPSAEFHLVGPLNEYKVKSSNIHQYGYMKTPELKQLYKKMDIAVGSLGLYRKQMYEACPLKVREYCAIGLPVIMGYRDTDLNGTDFILEIENNADGVKNSIDKIHDFIAKWKGKRIDREVAANYLDTGKKEKRRLKFMEKIAAANLHR